MSKAESQNEGWRGRGRGCSAPPACGRDAELEGPLEGERSKCGHQPTSRKQLRACSSRPHARSSVARRPRKLLFPPAPLSGDREQGGYGTEMDGVLALRGWCSPREVYGGLGQSHGSTRPRQRGPGSATAMQADSGRNSSQAPARRAGRLACWNTPGRQRAWAGRPRPAELHARRRRVRWRPSRPAPPNDTRDQEVDSTRAWAPVRGAVECSWTSLPMIVRERRRAGN